jgi:hypothetical protein
VLEGVEASRMPSIVSTFDINQVEIKFNRMQAASNASNIFLEIQHQANQQGSATSSELRRAWTIVRHNSNIIWTYDFDPGGTIFVSSSYLSPSGNPTFQTGDNISIYGFTDGEATGPFGILAAGPISLEQTYTLAFPNSNLGAFIRTSPANTMVFLPSLSSFTSGSSAPLLVVKNSNIESTVYVSVARDSEIDDQLNQMYYLQNSTNTGGAITLFPNAACNSWYVAMDYIGRCTNSNISVTDWSNVSTNNLTSASLGSMNIVQINTAERSNAQNFLTLPPPSNGKLTLVSYTGPDNCGLQSLAFVGQPVDNLSAVIPGVYSNAFSIIGADQQRGAGAVFVSDSNRHYIIGHLTNPGDWWNNLITSRDLSQPNYTTGVLQTGYSVISNNINYQYKIYGPQFITSQTPNSCFSIIKVRNIVSGGDEDPMFVGHGPEYQTSSIFASSLQYIYKHYNQKSYECLWLGSESIDGNSRFAFYPINSYSADNNY